MISLTEQQLFLTLVAVAVVLLAARTGGELARRVGQPEVLGELVAGFLLGPSALGALLPHLYSTIFLHRTEGTVLSGLSWVGAILVLLVAGLEVDLDILRKEARVTALGAAFTIVPSLAGGILFSTFLLGKVPSSGIFLGIVLSVTAVSVAAKILMEREVLRRRYAQVILAVGVTSEVLVWLQVSVASALHTSAPVLAGLKSAGFALAFFVFMMTLGRRFIFWSMRRVSDSTSIVRGQLSLVVVLTFVAAAVTQILGLHALLGAFVMGVILARSPRTNTRLMDGLQTVTVGIFAPIFFALAGMRVDVLQIATPSAMGTVLLLFLAASAIKVGFGTLGGRLGGLKGWEAALVGVGLNLKGGTDVIVAIVGRELGLLSPQAYTMYTLVAIVTVLVSPPVISLLERRAPPEKEEAERLEHEEAARRAYVPRIERVLVPVMPELRSSLPAAVIERVAASKHEQGQIFDISELVVETPRELVSARAEEAKRSLNEATNVASAELTTRRVAPPDALKTILDAAANHDLLAIGAKPPSGRGSFSLGRLQDSIIDSTHTDVLVAVDHSSEAFDCSQIRRILVPTNGLEYSMSAGDIAGSLAEACGAEVTILHVAQPSMDDMFWRQKERRSLVRSTSRVVDELAFRLSRLDVNVDKRILVAQNVAGEILGEVERGKYNLLVMGGIDRGSDGRLYLGQTISAVIRRATVPTLLLIAHE